MDLFILFAQTVDNTEPPTALLVWAEYDVDGNPDGFKNAVAQIVEKHQLNDKQTWSAYKVMKVNVNVATVSKYLSDTPVLKGEVKS